MLVKNVRFVNNKVEIELEEKTIYISKENYIENPVTVDSYLNEERIKTLLDFEKVIESKMEVVKKLNKKLLTEQEIINFLKGKQLQWRYIKEILNSLTRVGLINDEYVASLIIESLLVKRKGKLEIKNILKERGIKEDLYANLVNQIDEEIYMSNFNKVCEKYMKMYSNKSSAVKEQMIKHKLREYGYEEYLISDIKIDKNVEEEIELARLSLKKILNNKKLDLNNYENKNKIKLKLVMKGFSYDIINVVLEEVVNDEIN